MAWRWNVIIGDRVVWESQAQGRWKTKQGKVVAVVPAYERASRYVPDGYNKVDGWGMSRNHESYIVAVGQNLYWPRVSALKVVSSGRATEDVKEAVAA
jgi:hypothetical protein